MGALGIVTGALGAVWSLIATVLWGLFGFLRDFRTAASVAIFGWCVGLFAGAVIVKHWRRATARSARETARKLAAQGAKSRRKDGSAPRLPPDVIETALKHIPRWARDPDWNRAAFLNRVLDALWPHVDTSVCEVVRDSVEPILRDLVPGNIVHWIGFEKLTLGPTPPTIGGVKVLGSGSDDVVLELELQWASGADIVLAAYVFGVRVPVRVSDVQLVAAVRVNFTPLVDELPCLGGIEVSLLGMPDHLDLAAVVPPGVDLMALPMMDVLVPWILRKILNPMFVYPSRMIIPIMDNSGMEPPATGMIKVRVNGGYNMNKRRRGGKATGLVIPGSKLIGFGGERYQIQLYTRHQRKVMLKSKSRDEPNWDELHYFLANAESTLRCVLLTMNMRELGRCEIPMRLLCDPSREGKTANLYLPIEDPTPYQEEEPELPVPDKRATAADIERMNKEYSLAMKRYNEKLAKLRLEQLAKAKIPEPRPDTPTVAIDLEYVPMNVGKPKTSLSGITSVASPDKVPMFSDDDSEEEGMLSRRRGRGASGHLARHREPSGQRAQGRQRQTTDARVRRRDVGAEVRDAGARGQDEQAAVGRDVPVLQRVGSRRGHLEAVRRWRTRGVSRGVFGGDARRDAGHGADGHVLPGRGQEQRADLRAVQVLLPVVMLRRTRGVKSTSKCLV